MNSLTSQPMNIDEFISTVWEHKPIKQEDLMSLFATSKEVLSSEPTLLKLTAPIVVCGNVHGQFYDLRRLLELNGKPPETKYLFLGDYVDYGYYSLETTALLLAYKCRYPDRVYLLRGHHESRMETLREGFYEEVVQRFGDGKVWEGCMEVFDCLPIAALIGSRIFCAHGGIGESFSSVDEISDLDRPDEIPVSGPIMEIVTSNPDEVDGFVLPEGSPWMVFGKDVTQQFCQKNKLDLIARSHQLAMDGYEYAFDGLVVTIWSAPSFKYRVGNQAAVMHVSESLEKTFKVFDAVPNDQRVIPKGRF